MASKRQAAVLAMVAIQKVKRPLLKKKIRWRKGFSQ